MTELLTEQSIADEVEDLRSQLVHHRAFSLVRSMADLRVFMEAHVFAVWDFMSLVKRLQLDFTVTSVPWTPPRWPLAARLINEIVTGEESDIGLDGQPISHYELYLNAMADVGADCTPIERFVHAIESGLHTEQTGQMEAPGYVVDFVRHTLRTATLGSTAEVVGSFFYGREDVIPSMFQGLLDDWHVDPASVPQLIYYLERHIELDADEHGPAARTIVNRMLEQGASYREIADAARSALEQRVALWDGLADTLDRRHQLGR